MKRTRARLHAVYLVPPEECRECQPEPIPDTGDVPVYRWVWILEDNGMRWTRMDLRGFVAAGEREWLYTEDGEALFVQAYVNPHDDSDIVYREIRCPDGSSAPC